MNILLQSRIDLFTKPGGDTEQIKKTQEQLRHLGVSAKISAQLTPDLSGFDMVHVFNITRPYESAVQIRNARQQHKTVVFTPIMQHFEQWDSEGRYGLQRMVFRALPTTNAREWVKNIVRFSMTIPDIRLLGKVLLRRYRTLQSYCLSHSNYLLVNSSLEADDLRESFNNRVAHAIAHVGVDSSYTRGSPELFRSKHQVGDFVLCVGHFTSKKNHLNLIRAMNGMSIPLVLIGRPLRHHERYFAKIEQEVKKNPWITILTNAPKEEILSAYAAARMHVLASWFESTPLVNLEAGLAGCNVVTTSCGYAKEYIQDMGWYCDPGDTNSIRTAIQQAYNAPKTDRLKQYILQYFRWELFGQQTLAAYRQAQSSP